MRNWFIAAFCILTLTGCGGSDSTSTGENPFKPESNSEGSTNPDTSVTPSQPEDSGLARMSLAASQYTVKSDNSDTATITVTALDKNNAALEGAPISIQASAGILNSAKSVTGPDGTAEFTFRSGPERANQVVTVTAGSGILVKTVPIMITGTTLSLDASKTSVLQDDSQGIILSGQALDAAGNPLFGEELALSSSLGNTFIATDNLGRPLSGSTIVLTTNVNGEFRATFNGDILGQDRIILNGCGVQRDLLLTVKETNFGFVSPAQDTFVPVDEDKKEPVDLLVQWNGTGQTLTFTASHGHFVGEGDPEQVQMTTDPLGQAMVRYIASDLATPATIQASDSSGVEAFLNLNVLTVDPNRLDLQGFPVVLPPSVGNTTSTSTVIATVRDLSNNPVRGARVNFQIINGPGGGEAISPVSTYTDASGQATTTFTAGNLTSGQGGIQIRAESNGLITNDETDLYLTIGQKAARVVIGTTNRLEIIERDGMEVAYGMPVTVLVTDNNGNPIAGQRVNLGIYPIRFKTGYWLRITDLEVLGVDPAHSEIIVSGIFGNEDGNRNGILDSGEDKIIPNGRLDPGNVASIPKEVITDENGLAAYKVIYAKSYACWVDVELSAATMVSGSETKTIMEQELPWLSDENGYPVEPVINSPFGL